MIFSILTFSSGISNISHFSNKKHVYTVQSNYSGLTGQVEFDSTGIRSDIEIDVMSLDAGGLKKIGSFKPTRETYPYMPVTDQKEEVVDTSNLPIDQMTFTVITSLVRIV